MRSAFGCKVVATSIHLLEQILSLPHFRCCFYLLIIDYFYTNIVFINIKVLMVLVGVLLGE